MSVVRSHQTHPLSCTTGVHNKVLFKEVFVVNKWLSGDGSFVFTNFVRSRSSSHTSLRNTTQISYLQMLICFDVFIVQLFFSILVLRGLAKRMDLILSSPKWILPLHLTTKLKICQTFCLIPFESSCRLYVVT